MVLGRSVHHSPLAIYPSQIDNALVCLAGIGKVRTLRNVQLGIKLLHIFVEGIDLHFAVVSAMYNAERAVDQTEGLAAVAGFDVGADDLYRIAAQQFLDVFLAGLRGRGVAFNVNLSGINKRFRTRPLLGTRIPGWGYRHNAGRVFMIHIAGMTGMLAIAIVKLEILRQINGDRAFPVAVRQLILITHRVIVVHQTITGIMVVGSLANDIDNVLAKVKVIAHFGIIGCCITYNLKDDRSVSRSDPLYIIVSQCDGFRGSISSGKGVARNCFIVLTHILRCIHRDRAGVRAGAALNVTNGKRAVQQGICLISVVNTGVDAVNCHHVITQQVFDSIFAGLSGINRGILSPHSIQSSRPSIAIRDNIIAILRYGTCGGSFCAVTVVNRVRPIICLPALENIAIAGGNGVLNIKSVRSDSRICCRPRISAGCTRTSVSVIRQRVCIFSDGIGVLRYEINRSALVAGGRTAHVKRPGFGICIGFFRPTDDLVTAVDTCTTSCCLDVTDGDCVIVICRVAMIRRVLANKLRIFRSTIIVANIEFVTHIQDSESNIDLVSCIQSRQCVERQQGQCHHKHQNPSQQPLSCFLSSHKKIPPSFGRNTAHRRGSMNASATGCHAVRGHRLGSWLCDTGFRRLCLLSAHLLVSVSRTAYD